MSRKILVAGGAGFVGSHTCVALVEVFHTHDIAAICHFAGLKSLSGSTAAPITYHENHVYGT